MIEDFNLLKRWAELEPDVCKYWGPVASTQRFHLSLNGDALWIVQVPWQPICLSRLLGVLLGAIAQHQIRCHLQNDSASNWHATLLDANCTASTGQHSEPAIALLQAYVSWLEKGKVEGAIANTGGKEC